MGAFSLLAGIFSARLSRRFARWWTAMNMAVVGIKVVVSGLENLALAQEGGGGFILAANHSSAADIAAVPGGLPADICWVTKASLTRIPFLGWHLSRVHVPVARRCEGGAMARG